MTTKYCGNSSVGRARPCQGRGREFESRFPLNDNDSLHGCRFSLKEETRTSAPERSPVIGELAERQRSLRGHEWREEVRGAASGSSLVFRSPRVFAGRKGPFCFGESALQVVVGQVNQKRQSEKRGLNDEKNMTVICASVKILLFLTLERKPVKNGTSRPERTL